jgi:hypothetical protein
VSSPACHVSPTICPSVAPRVTKAAMRTAHTVGTIVGGIPADGSGSFVGFPPLSKTFGGAATCAADAGVTTTRGFPSTNRDYSRTVGRPHSPRQVTRIHLIRRRSRRGSSISMPSTGCFRQGRRNVAPAWRADSPGQACRPISATGQLGRPRCRKSNDISVVLPAPVVSSNRVPAACVAMREDNDSKRGDGAGGHGEGPDIPIRHISNGDFAVIVLVGRPGLMKSRRGTDRCS